MPQAICRSISSVIETFEDQIIAWRLEGSSGMGVESEKRISWLVGVLEKDCTV